VGRRWAVVAECVLTALACCSRAHPISRWTRDGMHLDPFHEMQNSWKFQICFILTDTLAPEDGTATLFRNVGKGLSSVAK
jgi:hypothetical protein